MSDWLSTVWTNWGISWPDLLLGVTLWVVMFVGSLAAVTFVLIRLPADYFRGPHPPPFWPSLPPWLGLTVHVAKNVLGAGLILFGIFLSLPGMPGQGLLTILIGLMLLDFPGKRRLEKKLVKRPRILHSINRIRARFGKPPLVLDDEENRTFVEPAGRQPDKMPQG